jgi:phosphoenolpyruvate carboxylase
MLQALLDITGHPQLLANQTNLRKMLQMRNPYIEPLNILQV